MASVNISSGLEMVGLTNGEPPQTEPVEPRKYSTGTKGRLKMHSDKCREFIHANAPGFSLASEFIASVDPDHEDRVWQRFQTPSDILPELQEWLGVETVKPAAASHSSLPKGILPARTLLPPSGSPASVKEALNQTRTWIASSEGRSQLEKLAPTDAAEAALLHFSGLLSTPGAGQ